MNGDGKALNAEAKEELEFVQNNKTLIKSMRQCYDLINIFCTIFKAKGIQQNSLKEWGLKVQKYKSNESLCDKGLQFIKKMNSYLDKQKETMPQEKQILCCSDIIESTFGKYKNKRVKMITDDVLKIAGYSNQITLEGVQKAMQGMKTVDVIKWKEKNTTVSKLALLKRKRKSAA